MLKPESLKFIQDVASEFGATRVLLFGSCLEVPEEAAGDIDIAVEGLSRPEYWAFWKRLLWADELNGKSVDVVRIEENVPILPIILDEGVTVYERDVSAVSV